MDGLGELVEKLPLGVALLTFTSESQNFTLYSATDHMVTISLVDGSIQYGANYTPDAAAKAFWEAIGISKRFQYHSR